MIDLDSPRWQSLRGSCGLSHARDYLRRFLSGETEALDELLHQVCHQFTVVEVAYAVIPHLIDFCRRCNRDKELTIGILSLVGFVEAGRRSDPRSHEIPSDLAEPYSEAIASALDILGQTLIRGDLTQRESLELIGTFSALAGHQDLATVLLTTGTNCVIECQVCGESVLG